MKIRKICKKFSSIRSIYRMEGCTPSLLFSGEGGLMLRNSSIRICHPVPPQPSGTHRGPTKEVVAALLRGLHAEERTDTHHTPPAPPSHKRRVLCRNVKCILRTDRDVTALGKCFHPLTRNKTHVRSQKAVFAPTNSAGCCLAVQDLPAPPKAFLMPRKQHFMNMLPSLPPGGFFLITQA